MHENSKLKPWENMLCTETVSDIQNSVSKGRDVPGQTGTGCPVVPLSRDKKIFLSRCPVVPGQGQEQMSRDKLLCPGPSRDKTIKKFQEKRPDFPF